MNILMIWFRVEDKHLMELMTEIKGCFDKIKKLGSFEGFSLNLQKYGRISDEGVEMLSSKIGENMNHLSHLMLNFSK